MNYPYKNDLVRDLAWACFDPPLVDTGILSAGVVSNCALLLTPERERALEQLDANPTPLIDHMAKLRSHRLGIYFESLWHFFLEHDPAVDLIVHNLPIRSDGKTIGEFDCIYFCHHRKRHVHLELAVKFFLGVADASDNPTNTEPAHSSELNQWWGPECQDRLDLKVRHLLDRQIILSEHSAAKLRLAEFGIESLDREVEIKGYLFQPQDNPILPPVGYVGASIPDQWVHLKNLVEHSNKLEATHFKHLPKFEWLSPRVETETAHLLSASELNQKMLHHFESESRPQLVSTLNEAGVECGRFFVVGNVWPFGSGERLK
ncbi:MAG: DUF1853 family protein [Halioglobus sp.]